VKGVVWIFVSYFSEEGQGCFWWRFPFEALEVDCVVLGYADGDVWELDRERWPLEQPGCE
jgi:hypothetical protein